MIKDPTDTSKWALAIHRVSANSAEVWIGTLFPTLIMPKRARVRLWLPDGNTRTSIVQKNEWKRPFRKSDQRFWSVVSFRGLRPNTAYRVEFHRFVEAKGNIIESGWQHLRSGFFETLPKRIPTTSEKPFTIGLGSCYYDHRDGGQAAAATPETEPAGSSNATNNGADRNDRQCRDIVDLRWPAGIHQT